MMESQETFDYMYKNDESVNLSSDKGTFKHFVRCVSKSPKAIFGFVVLFTLIVMALFSPWIAPNDPELVELGNYLMPPAWSEGGSWVYPLGTDSLGRCILSRIVYGSRISLLVGFVAVCLSGAIGVSLGLVAGFMGKIVDDIIMRISDVLMAFPFILLSIAILAVLGSGVMNVIIVLAISGWVTYARLVRGSVISEREKEYVEAARSIGLPNRIIIFKHIFPNVINGIIVIASFSFASTILSEASLSFLGMGVPPSTPTWGGMISLARSYVFNAPWMAIYPGIAIAITVLGINLLGDWIRDYLDPKTANY